MKMTTFKLKKGTVIKWEEGLPVEIDARCRGRDK